MAWLNPPEDRSIACVGEQILCFRTKRGWTQEDLARESGYSDRLIAKAESNGSLNPGSIDVLAETLSWNGQIVHPEDLTSSPRELAEAFLHAIANHEAEMVDRVRHFLSDDLETYVPGGEECSPLSGIHRGITGLDNYVRIFFEIFGPTDKETATNTSVICVDGNRVVVACFVRMLTQDIVVKAPPEMVEANPCGPVSIFMVFSRGKIITIQFLFDSFAIGRIASAWREGQPVIVDEQFCLENKRMEPWDGRSA